MDTEALRKLIEDDNLGLLDVKPIQSGIQSKEERLIEKFYKITEFISANEREPIKNPSNMQEAQLAMSLEGIRKAPDKIKALQALDEFGLLAPPVVLDSIADVFEDDDLGILSEDSSAADIFNLKHVSERVEMPDYIAQRESCKDFDQFEGAFKACHQDLRNGKRQLLQFANEQQIQQGQFFVLKGVMAYVAGVGEKEKKGGKVNARLRCIFENGTESAMLLRSLARELYRDGRRVTEHEGKLINELGSIKKEDSQTGYIYVLKSLSSLQGIADQSDLYKIGYSSISVEERIKNAKNEPTYLMAPVKIVTSFECYNLNPQKLELILHKFFGQVCLEVDVFDNNAKRHTPREWFIAPITAIEEAIRLVITGEIVGFKYDKEERLIRVK